MPIHSTKKGCQIMRTLRDGLFGLFFPHTDLNKCMNCPFKFCEIVELMFWFVIKMFEEKTIVKLTGRAKTTVIDWFEQCHCVCSVVKQKMADTDAVPIQINEARFADRTWSSCQQKVIKMKWSTTSKITRTRILVLMNRQLLEAKVSILEVKRGVLIYLFDYYYWKMRQ